MRRFFVSFIETSPHTRGEPILFAVVSVTTRNIPAYAGRTATAAFRLTLKEKHPRIRGENYVVAPRSV